jgi:hypothetical protein
MRRIREGRVSLTCLALLLLLSGCGGETDQVAEHQCRSPDVRSSVLRIFSDDDHNALVTFALRNSSSLAAALNAENPESERLEALDRARKAAVYSLGGTTPLKSEDKATREVTCIEVLSVTVLDTRADKEMEFKVKRAADNTLLVSVSPFRFKVQPF